jgi:hypothetical protein
VPRTLDFRLLAELLVVRLTPALPEGIVLRRAIEEDIEGLRRMRALAPIPPRFPSPPEYGLDDGVLVIEVQPPPARRIVPITYSGQRPVSDRDVADAVNEALQAVADEASEASTDRYESDTAVNHGKLRLWFGVVPPNAPEGRPWRQVIAELPPIALSQIAN